MNAIEIIETYLKENGFDGLFNTEGECSCELADLCPCEMINSDCELGHKKPCDCEGEPCNFHMSAEKG